MPKALSKISKDPFKGLLLPVSAWRALEKANITSLGHLKALAPQIALIGDIDPETVAVIKDRLERRAAKRIVRVRLVFPKLPLRKVSKPATKSRGDVVSREQVRSPFGAESMNFLFI
jgi:hypothetical protein